MHSYGWTDLPVCHRNIYNLQGIVIVCSHDDSQDKTTVAAVQERVEERELSDGGPHQLPISEYIEDETHNSIAHNSTPVEEVTEEE